MSSRRQRERMRKRMMAFDNTVEKNRKIKEFNDKIDAMTKAQLIEYAKENNIEIDKTAKKAEIVAKIKEQADELR